MAEPGKITPSPTAGRLVNVAAHQLVALAATCLALTESDGLDDPAPARMPGDVLGELLVALRMHDGLSRNAYPPEGTVAARSRAMAHLEAAVARVVRRYQDLANAAVSPNVLPAGLEDGATRAGADLQVPRTSAQDVIDLDQAGALLGVGRERARQLVREYKLTSWSRLTGRHELQVYRGEVIALREQRSGDDGIGGREERPGDPGRTPGGGSVGGDRAA